MNNENSIIIENFNLGLFKTLIIESLNTSQNLMIEFSNDFVKSLSITTTNTLLKIGYSKFTSFTNQSEIPDFSKFNIFVLEGSNLKKYLDLYSELEQTKVTFTTINDINSETPKLVANKMQITGFTKNNKTKLTTVFTFTSSNLMVTTIDDYQDVINKLKYNSDDFSEINLIKNNYTEISNLIKNLHKTVATNSNYLEINISKNGLNCKDKVFDITLEPENILKLNEESIDFKVMKNDFKLLGEHNWKIGTSNESDKLILMTKLNTIEAKKDNSIIFGCILTKTNNAVVLSNNPEDFDDTDDDFGLDLSEYEGI